MPEIRENGKTHLTLEQLLALKRSEKPRQEFWEEFDQEFQRRRLAALVNTMPWYISAGRVLNRAMRMLAPVAAVAAALAFGLFSLFSRNPSNDDAPAAAPRVATTEAVPSYTLLDEEYISPVGHVQREQIPVAAETTREVGRLHYTVREIGMTSTAPKQFVTVASPHVLAVSDENSSGYFIRTLTASPALGLGTQSTQTTF
jgi:hypothetical protein